jgi:hypothetical protein
MERREGVRGRGKVQDGSEDKSLWKIWAMSEDGVYKFDYLTPE